jgi:hypothetical protein
MINNEDNKLENKRMIQKFSAFAPSLQIDLRFSSYEITM